MLYPAVKTAFVRTAVLAGELVEWGKTLGCRCLCLCRHHLSRAFRQPGDGLHHACLSSRRASCASRRGNYSGSSFIRVYHRFRGRGRYWAAPLEGSAGLAVLGEAFTTATSASRSSPRLTSCLFQLFFPLSHLLCKFLLFRCHCGLPFRESGSVLSMIVSMLFAFCIEFFSLCLQRSQPVHFRLKRSSV